MDGADAVGEGVSCFATECSDGGDVVGEGMGVDVGLCGNMKPEDQANEHFVATVTNSGSLPF